MANEIDELAIRIGLSLAQAVRGEARGRQYPVAWSSLEPESKSIVAPKAEDLLQRPPPGAASVRPSVPAPQRRERADDAVLEHAAEQAFFSTNESGEATFELMISDELFDNLRCSITVGRNGVCAVFHVGGDVDLRRLLEAESGRLRTSLEERGLRSVTVKIEGG